MPDFASDREAIWSAYRDWQDGITEPEQLLGIEPGSWLAYDLRSALAAFGGFVERQMRERVEAYADSVREFNRQQRDAKSKHTQEYSKVRAQDEAEEAWYYWVRSLVRIRIGVAAGSTGDASIDSLDAVRVAGTRYLVKPATYDPDIDNDMGTDDVQMVTE